MNDKKLYKIPEEKKISGVCAGLAEYLNADVSLIRILWVLVALVSFSIGFWVYIACALIFPDKKDIFY